MHKIEKVQERALRLFHNDNVSSYNDLLLKSQRCIMHVHRLISIEIFKTLNGLNPTFMNDIINRVILITLLITDQIRLLSVFTVSNS